LIIFATQNLTFGISSFVAFKKIGITKDDMFIKLITSNDYEDVMNENNKFNSEEETEMDYKKRQGGGGPG
jgi:hypothetical protein